MASARRNGRALLALAILLLLPAILFAAYTWITLHVSSENLQERASCKTWKDDHCRWNRSADLRVQPGMTI
jgi:hypothetical protein